MSLKLTGYGGSPPVIGGAASEMDPFVGGCCACDVYLIERTGKGTLPRIGPLQYLEDVERLQLIRLIDAEIERLQQAKLLILPSLVPSRLRQPEASPRSGRPQAKKKVSERAEEMTPAAPGASIPQEQPEVAVTRVAAKKRFRPRNPRPMKQAHPTAPIALTSNVPLHPVAAPPKRDAGIPLENSYSPSTVQPAAVSAFGQAISRGLAALNK